MMFTISNSTIRMINGLYSLNDLHKAIGGSKKYKPANFMRLENTKNLIAEIERCSDVSIEAKSRAYKIIRGGEIQRQGTFVCRELVYSYAMWINTPFQLMVIRALDSMMVAENSFDALCREYSTVNRNLSDAGRFLAVAGKQIKPQLQRKIDNKLKQMQSSLELIGGGLS